MEKYFFAFLDELGHLEAKKAFPKSNCYGVELG